jgi:hypothetical protein
MIQAYPGSRAVQHIGLHRLIAGITGSNPTDGMDVRLLFLYCVV